MGHRPILRVLFICRGSSAHGLGHVLRARTVARLLGRRAAVRLVVLGDAYVDALLAGRGLPYDIVADVEGVLAVHAACRPQVVVLDLTEFPPAALEQLRRSALVVSLSPICNVLPQVDLIFHRTRHTGDDWNFADPAPEVRCGLAYAVIRENCEKIPTEVYRQTLAQEPLSVMVSLGGTDAGNKTLQVLEALQALPGRLLVWVLLGEGYAHSYQALADCAKGNPRHEVILATTSDSMWRVMRTCAVAVVAGGTITYEAAFAGLPSINVFESGRSVFLVQELLEKGACLSAGYPLVDALSVVNANLTHLAGARDELLGMHLRARELIDGQGAARIAEEIEAFYWERFLPAHPERVPAALSAWNRAA